MHAVIQGSQLQVISASGHLPNLENPATFNAAIRTFLQNLNSKEKP
jgi:pimeloyl-ACP methyl ester carboxylesterase